MAVLARITIAVALVGCYDPGSPPAGRCEVSCSANHECPGDLTCLSDNLCHRNGDEICSATDFVRREVMAGGTNHTCAIAADRTLACWGANYGGQLAVDPAQLARVAMPLPADIPSHAHWSAIAAAADATCAIDVDGALVCWGDAATGGLPTATTGAIAPTVIDKPAAGQWQSVALATNHGCAVFRPDDVPSEFGGDVYCWGDNTDGAVGVAGNRGAFTTPTRVDLAALAGYRDWIEVGTGDHPFDQSIGYPVFNHTCARRQGGAVWCFGTNKVAGKEVGVPSDPDEAIAQPGEYTRISVGDTLACGATLGGEVYCWGKTVNLDATRAERAADALLPTATTWTAVAVGTAYACAASSTGQVRCFGASPFGERGARDDREAFGVPPPQAVDVALASGVPAADLAAGANHTCALVPDGWQCWGNNRHGQLGRGEFGDQLDAIEVGIGIAWQQISAGSSLTCGVGDPGGGARLYCWGSNDYHLFASGATPAPHEIAADARSVAVADEHACYSDSTNAAYCWGYNYNGQLGRDGTTPQDSPLLVVDATGAGVNLHALTAKGRANGGASSCGVADDGTVMCWGSLMTAHHPTETNPKLTFMFATDSLVEGRNAVCAIIGGGLSCWGLFAMPGGALVNGVTPTPVPLPMMFTGSLVAPPAAPTPTDSIAVGNNHMCAHRNGYVMCWGANDLGQSSFTPGPPVVDATSLPLMMPDYHLAAGDDYTCVGGESGIVLGPPRCWGQLAGFALQTPTTIPTHGSEGLAIGSLHACSIGNGGHLYCWGRNDNNQLGAGYGYDPHPAPVVAR